MTTITISGSTMKLKRILLVIPFLAMVISLAYADADIDKFALEPGLNKVTVIWESKNEIDVRGYEVQRGLSKTDFSRIGFVRAKETTEALKKYEYVDNTVFKSTNNGRTYFYRLKIMNHDGSFKYSKIEEVSPTISSARQTWGSIKAMFR